MALSLSSHPLVPVDTEESQDSAPKLQQQSGISQPSDFLLQVTVSLAAELILHLHTDTQAVQADDLQLSQGAD